MTYARQTRFWPVSPFTTRVRSADVNECLQNPSPCEASCQNLDGGFACGCPAGFALDPADNSTCRDLDECAAGQHICQQLCVNTHGSYKCGCRPGYRQVGDRCLGTRSRSIMRRVFGGWEDFRKTVFSGADFGNSRDENTIGPMAKILKVIKSYNTTDIQCVFGNSIELIKKKKNTRSKVNKTF